MGGLGKLLRQGSREKFSLNVAFELRLNDRNVSLLDTRSLTYGSENL